MGRLGSGPYLWVALESEAYELVPVFKFSLGGGYLRENIDRGNSCIQILCFSQSPDSPAGWGYLANPPLTGNGATWTPSLHQFIIRSVPKRECSRHDEAMQLRMMSCRCDERRFMQLWDDRLHRPVNQHRQHSRQYLPHHYQQHNHHCNNGTLAIDGWAVTFGTARRGLGGAAARPGPSSLYQM